MLYEDFLSINTSFLTNESNHCVNYFGYRVKDKIKLICAVANDTLHIIRISSAEIHKDTDALPSFSAVHLSFHIFEREIHENFGIKYTDHPWLKPVRFAFNRANKASRIENYPFYNIDSEELHEVGVGPIHAGVIEPGHFRFICDGEQILHLEIQLGYQHRGIEQLFLDKKNLLQRTVLAESIAGDTTVGHTTSFVNLWESLCNFTATEDVQISRTIALELERIAMHTVDMSALCTDIAYQLGSAVFGRLRTPVINFFQIWCGNRLAKGLIRVGSTHFYFSNELKSQLEKLLNEYERDYTEIWDKVKSLPTALVRLEKTGVVTRYQAISIGAVGMAAKASELNRDVRSSHPHDKYHDLNHEPIIKHHGDVYSRMQIRNEEIMQSIAYIRKLISELPAKQEKNNSISQPSPKSFGISMVEGWRGEICHCAITDENGELIHYKVKDPSMHNWLALALSVRKNEISDFPICNKSFNLSYCGHDL
ncbi:MAG: NADH-quinone oxidoreductase subunit C [Saprospiraceae bacterium]|nr:NADH-quinone oxidoreductase subunit C [Saprospiraceae bacterium]